MHSLLLLRFQMYSTLLLGAKTHKDVHSRAWLVRFYYSNRIFMGYCCVACEVRPCLCSRRTVDSSFVPGPEGAGTGVVDSEAFSVLGNLVSFHSSILAYLTLFPLMYSSRLLRPCTCLSTASATLAQGSSSGSRSSRSSFRTPSSRPCRPSSGISSTGRAYRSWCSSSYST